MSFKIPMIIQGGMGAGVSGWFLAQTVSKLGQLGVVAGTALDEILARRLQDGDPDGHARRALGHFPLHAMAQRILDAYFIPDGKPRNSRYCTRGMHTIEGSRDAHEMCIAGNFVEVFLAREGHDHPVGINYLEKIQYPHLASIYGAMLAGVSVITMGAGIPVEIPAAIEALSEHLAASYAVHVAGAGDDRSFRMHFDPSLYAENHGTLPPPLKKPAFLPIISSETLAKVLYRKTNGKLDGFIIEGNLAGGHNAPPRGASQLTDDGQPVYGPRDVTGVKLIRNLGLPFWMAGSYGSPEGLRTALDMGAAGIQVGTAFALCRESCLAPAVRKELIKKALTGSSHVFTDPVASPTGFPFKVVALEGSLSEQAVYDCRRRTCDLGFLREAYLKPDGRIGYRCPAEPEQAFIAKGGKIENTVARKCLCNALIANIDMPQLLTNGTREKYLVTLGDDWHNIGRFCTPDQPEYGAEDVIKVLLKDLHHQPAS